MTRTPVRLLMLASGFAGLGYQMVWTRQFALWIGHDLPAVLAVVAAFFGGMALGAWALSDRIERAALPARWYAACEAIAGLWALLLTVLLEPVSGLVRTALGVQAPEAMQWSATFVSVFILLLPATACLGATLPAMERCVRRPGADGQTIALLYALNTIGALLGVLGTVFWTIPKWGLSRTALLCALLSVGCAATAWRTSDRSGPTAPRTPGAKVVRGSPPARPVAALAWSGLLGIGYEVLVVRVLSQVAEDTVYTYAMLLAVYLVGTAIGAALYRRYRQGPAWTAAAACLAGTMSLSQAGLLKSLVASALGGGFVPALAAEGALAIEAFALPTVAMGMLFARLCTDAAEQGVPVGRSLAWNTLGSAAAPVVAGVWLLPLVGAKAALLAVSLGYLALASQVHAGVAATLFAAVVLGVGMPPLRFVDLPDGGRLVDYIEGRHGSVSVVEDVRGVLSLHIDNRQQEGSSATRWADARQALLPVLLQPGARRALFLGLGTGVTAAAATQAPGLQVDVVELLPEVAAAMHHFVDPLPDRLHLRIADARRFVHSRGPAYDLIVADNFHPARSGAGSLYTVEHFRAVVGRLAPGGLYCQWLPLHQMDLDTLRSIVASFLAANPHASAVLATNSLSTPVLGLVARREGEVFHVEDLHRQLAEAAHWPAPVASFGFENDWALLGSFVAGPSALRTFAGNAPLNTDDRPIVAYRAPRLAYAPTSAPRDRLLALLQALHTSPRELFGRIDEATAARLDAYWAARNHYLQIGRDIAVAVDPATMLDRLQAPLLHVLRTSPDFRPAYDPLLRLAAAQPDPARAQAVLQALVEIQPARQEAAQLLAAARPANRPRSDAVVPGAR